MLLRRIGIQNFRNLQPVDLELASGVTLFWGCNAQGKTNLLEAIHYLATGRSFRTRVDREVLPWGAPPESVARVEGTVERRDTTHRLALSLTERVKYAWIDGKAVARLGDLLGRMMIVLFRPEDIDIAAGPPGERRRFLDLALSQVRPAYLKDLQAYLEALRQRNAALKETGRWDQMSGGRARLDPWADLLIEHGSRVALGRREMIESMAQPLRETYAEIAPGDAPLSIVYESGFELKAGAGSDEAREQFRRRLLWLADRESERGQTIAGPHRDDFHLQIGDRAVRDYGSQGQKRSAALVLRLVQLQWMADQTGERPVLLVDDLGAELDRDRRGRLLRLFGAGVQTVATTAEPPDAIAEQLDAKRVIEVKEGEFAADEKTGKK